MTFDEWWSTLDTRERNRRIKEDAAEAFAADKLAESQAREKVLRSALNNQLNDCINFDGGKLTIQIMEASTSVLNQPTDDIALQDLILKERTRAVDTYKHLHQELVLKDALAAERDKCPLHDAADIATKAMRKAWQLGQTYWQQADSDSYKQNAKSAITQDSFNDLLDSTADAIRALEDE